MSQFRFTPPQPNPTQQNYTSTESLPYQKWPSCGEEKMERNSWKKRLDADNGLCKEDPPPPPHLNVAKYNYSPSPVFPLPCHTLFSLSMSVEIL